MRTSFHHQPEAQHPNFQLLTSWQADYPIFRKADIGPDTNDPQAAQHSGLGVASQIGLIVTNRLMSSEGCSTVYDNSFPVDITCIV
jgi:hypothetical protein